MTKEKTNSLVKKLLFGSLLIGITLGSKHIIDEMIKNTRYYGDVYKKTEQLQENIISLPNTSHEVEVHSSDCACTTIDVYSLVDSSSAVTYDFYSRKSRCGDWYWLKIEKITNKDTLGFSIQPKEIFGGGMYATDDHSIYAYSSSSYKLLEDNVRNDQIIPFLDECLFLTSASKKD
jgi:hypothetical protein